MADISTFLADFVKEITNHGAEKAEFNRKKVEEIEGELFYVKNGDLEDIIPNSIDLESLDGLLNYRKYLLKQNPNFKGVFTVSSQEVHLGEPFIKGAVSMKNLWYACAEPIVANLNFLGKGVTQEEFLINLKTCFDQEAGDIEELIATIGTIVAEDSVTVADDGITQKVSTRSGLNVINKKKVSLFKLKPYETFSEVQEETPTRLFLVRVTKTSKDDDGDGLKCIKISLHTVQDASVDNAISLAIKDYLVAALVKDGLSNTEAQEMILI